MRKCGSMCDLSGVHDSFQPKFGDDEEGELFQLKSNDQEETEEGFEPTPNGNKEGHGFHATSVTKKSVADQGCIANSFLLKALARL